MIRLNYTRPWLYPKQESAFFNSSRISMVEATTKAGKAQPLDAIVYCPSGPRKIGDLKVGDAVLIPDGGAANVVGVYPQGIRPIARISFYDGSIVEADYDHLWEIRAPNVGSCVISTTAISALIIQRVYVCVPMVDLGDRTIISREFKSIEFSRYAEAVCIEIDHPRHLYLTNGFIPTHNTVAGMAWIIETALHGKKDWNYWWIAPVTAQAKIAYRRIKSGLAKNAYTSQETEKKITLRGGQHIWFKGSDDSDSLFGEDVYGAVVDEGSRVKEDSYHAIRSTLTATRGPLRVIGNVKGRKNWFYRMSRRAESAPPGTGIEYHKITAYDAIEAGIIEDEEVRLAQRDLPPDIFKQLYLAEATDDEGNPFGYAAIRACLIEGMSMKPPVCWGWDLGKSVDYTVGIALDEDGVVCRFERFQLPWTATINIIRNRTGRTPALVDSTGLGDPILEANLQTNYGSNFEGFKFTGPSKQQLMEGLAVAIHHKTVRFPEGPISIELDQFEYEFSRTGVKYSAPEGLHDDCVCSIALAVRKKSDPSSVQTWLKAFGE